MEKLGHKVKFQFCNDMVHFFEALFWIPITAV